MTDYDFFDLTRLPFDPPEKAAQKVTGAIEKAKKEIGHPTNDMPQWEYDKITGKQSFLDKIIKKGSKDSIISNDDKLTPAYDELAKDKVKKEIEKLRAFVSRLKQSGSHVITDRAIRGHQKERGLSKKNVEDVFRAAGFTVSSTDDLIKKYPRFPTNADKAYAKPLEAFQNFKDQKSNVNEAALKQVKNLYDLAAYMAGEPENAAVYRSKSRSALKSLFDGFAVKYSARTDKFGHLCSSLATYGKLYVFDSEDHRQAYEAYLKYKTPSLTELFSTMKSFSMHHLLEPKFAEGCIKEIAAVFGDYEVSLAIYNKEAGFKDEFYIPAKKEPSHTMPEPELRIPEPIFEEEPRQKREEDARRKREEDEAKREESAVAFEKYFATAERAFLEGHFELARLYLSDAQAADPGKKSKTDELAARISAKERRKREEDETSRKRKEGWRELCVLKGHTDKVCSMSWSPDGRRIASGSGDNTVRIWDAESGRELRTLTGHNRFVYHVVWSPDGRRIASESYMTIKIWDAESGRELRTPKEVDSVAWTPDRRRIASAGSRYKEPIKIWDAESGRKLRTLKGHHSFVYYMTWSPDGRRIASKSRDKTVKIWDAESGRELRTLKEVDSVAWSPDGRRIASGSEDNTIKIWDAENWRELLTLKGHTDKVYSVGWSPDGRRIASGSGDNTVRIWDAENWRELRTLTGHNSYVDYVAWSPDGRRIASGSYYNKNDPFKIWDAENGRELLTLNKGNSSVAWSPDGRRIASRSSDRTIKIWDAESGSELFALTGHTSFVASVSWSPDGRRIASGSLDNTVRIWGVE
ncbi:MAG: WD40 repeat domain-containing protein [Spirochaetaceae bacterium]|jgi:WD40 repeat protein|nr:WD40 repeat domain-containing protein [Spirochaetaceae bacterium]